MATQAQIFHKLRLLDFVYRLSSLFHTPLLSESAKITNNMYECIKGYNFFNHSFPNLSPSIF